MNHGYNAQTMVCRCGRTKENHMNIELVGNKWRHKNAEGEVNLGKMFAEIEHAERMVKSMGLMLENQQRLTPMKPLLTR